MKVIWRHVWAGPWTLLGLLLGVFAWACGARWRRRDGAIEVAGGALGRWVQNGRHGLRAMTLGHVVLGCSVDWLDPLSAHERVHVRQYERWGPLFVPAYFAAGAWAALRGGDAYRDNRFEREALRTEASAVELTGLRVQLRQQHLALALVVPTEQGRQRRAVTR